MFGFGAYKNKLIEKLDILKASQFTFYPTGSRFFGNDNPASDFDFFTRACPEVQSFLTTNEFKRVSEKDYGVFFEDPFVEPPTVPLTISTPANKNNVAEVWRWGKIDVQLAEDPELKIAIQEVLKKYSTGKHNIMEALPRMLTKQGMVGFWNLLYDIANIKAGDKKSPVASDLETLEKAKKDFENYCGDGIPQ